MEAIDFANFILDIGVSHCPDSIKKILLGDAVFLIVIEALAVSYLTVKAAGAGNEIYELFYDVMELLAIDAPAYIFEQLADAALGARIKQFY